MLNRGPSLVIVVDREGKINQIPFVDDMALVADSEEKLCQLMEEFGQVCRRRDLKVNDIMNKVMKCTRGKGGKRINVALYGELLEEVECYKYLGSKITVDGGIDIGEVYDQ